jgi:kynurenine formamidase
MVSARFEQLADSVSNWGRWGDDDERGTLNLIEPGAEPWSEVDGGVVIPLALPLDATGPRTLGNQRRVWPTLSLLAHDVRYLDDPDDSAWSEDVLTTGLQAGTHWDALAHVSWRGRIYNDFGVDTITADRGATRCGIDKVGPLAGRSVLLDVARARGVAHLDNGDAITPADLDATAGAAVVRPGDIVLVRTGAMGRWLAGPGVEKKAYVSGSPGFAIECAEWFFEHDVAALATDTQNPDAFPSPEDTGLLMPFGVLAIRQIGMLLGQNFVLEDLAEACGARDRWSLVLAASPLPISGGLGSPVQPVAIL